MKSKAVYNYIKEQHTQEECSGFIDGYEKYQENMADKKYTEEDLRQAIERTYRYVDNDGWSLDYIKEDIINSLNKQDQAYKVL